MEFLKEHGVAIFMLTPLVISVLYMAYIVINREFFEKD